MKSCVRYAWTLGAAAILAGCAVGPRYVEPEPTVIELASPQAAQFDAQGGEAVPADWWRLFEDEGLTYWVEAALAHNHDVRHARANLLAARAVSDERRLDRLPGATADGRYSRGIQQRPGAGAEPVRSLAESFRAGFDMQWEIDLFGRLDRLREAATARAEASGAELDLMRLSVAADVARLWFEAQGLRRQLAAAEQEEASWRETLALAQALSRGGAGLPEEVQNARSNLLRSEAAIPPLRAALQRTRYRLGVLAGRRPGAVRANVGAATAVPLVKRLSLAGADRLIRSRPDVRRAERLLAASVEDVGAATADLYPRLSLGGFVGFFVLRDGDLGAAASRAFELTPGITWPALRWGNARARLRGAQALSEGALARYEQVLLHAQEEVENAVTQLAEAQQRLAALLGSARHAGAALEIAEKRYRAGSGSYQAVLENQRALFQLRQQIALAETASQIQVVALCKALSCGAGSAGRDSASPGKGRPPGGGRLGLELYSG
ncbi:TolC family protein [Pusillimonas caeni]|nr:TolC family protein [Pusillimonas caeni]